MKRIYFTVTNDLTYDQRMNRICRTLAENAYDVVLVGRRLPYSRPLRKEPYRQKRLQCFFKKGKWFYAEYNFRLFLYLFFRRMDAICAIDLDTILPCLYISKWKKIPRIYDAHELFTELKEVVTRPAVRRQWEKIERSAVPQFRLGYTVGDGIATEFNRRYGVRYETIRNISRLRPLDPGQPRERFILYQGAVNEGRAFEYVIPAWKQIDCKLVICGDGNFMPQLKELIRENGLVDQVELKGMLLPDELWETATRALLGIALWENEGLNQYLTLPNKLFDNIHAGIPQVTMNFPEFRKINEQFDVAVLIDTPLPQLIADTINNLLCDDVLYRRLQENCFKARKELNWQQEEKKLLSFYKTVFPS